ncbi:SMI1/KNR4 family protein [Nonomuraea sp. NPDC049709]|uniref:SMI1/KNR4 family protein n=1 Tax=Nonomuraea sp. NPDC049709 TaxID=3154736 RepID=UPI0034239920
MDRHAWKPFLQRWSEEWRVAHPGEEPDGDPWLGRPPATEDEVRALEARLGRVLPPSFREFLLVTNGWRNAGKFVWSLWSTEEIGWLADLEPRWADVYAGRDEEETEPAAARSLLISLEADAGVVYLDPGDVDERGEWAAYDVFSWTAMGPERHGSFYEKMYDFYAGFHALDRPRCETQRTWDAKVEDARLESLRGAVDRPLAVFAQAARFGGDRASFLHFQMRTLLRQDDDDPFRRLLRNGDTRSWTLDEGLFAAQVVPLLFAAHERDRRFGSGSTLQFLRERGPQRVRHLLGRHQALRSEPGFRLCFGNPEFDMAAHAALDAGEDASGGTGEDAWSRLRDALVHWRPLHEDQLAPIALLADPRAARLITPERGRELLATRRG